MPEPVGWNENYPIEPTAAVPGSEDKIEVLRQRAEHLARLHHPLDAGSQEKLYRSSERGGYCKACLSPSRRTCIYESRTEYPTEEQRD